MHSQGEREVLLAEGRGKQECSGEVVLEKLGPGASRLERMPWGLVKTQDSSPPWIPPAFLGLSPRDIHLLSAPGPGNLTVPEPKHATYHNSGKAGRSVPPSG